MTRNIFSNRALLTHTSLLAILHNTTEIFEASPLQHLSLRIQAHLIVQQFCSSFRFNIQRVQGRET